MATKFAIVCVATNMKITDIRSLKEFLMFKENHENVRVIVYHNLTSEHIFMGKNNGEYTYAQMAIEEKNYNKEGDLAFDYNAMFEYYNNNKNLGLSKNYNQALQLLSDDYWVMWSDDDTYFSLDYLENLYRHKDDDNVSILSGVVITGSGNIMSPAFRSKIGLYKMANKHISYADSKVKDVILINSGLCIKRNIYNIIGTYDENLFVDFIDFLLFDKLHDRTLDTALIVSGEIKQRFSAEEKVDIIAKKKRFKIFYNDFNHYCKIRNINQFYRIFKIARKRAYIYYLTLAKVFRR